jgi:hypothetical protein
MTRNLMTRGSGDDGKRLVAGRFGPMFPETEAIMAATPPRGRVERV